MWTPETRARYDRKELRYPSDLSDLEWRLIALVIPSARRGGRRCSVTCARCSTVSCSLWKRAANGATCREENKLGGRHQAAA